MVTEGTTKQDQTCAPSLKNDKEQVSKHSSGRSSSLAKRGLDPPEGSSRDSITRKEDMDLSATEEMTEDGTNRSEGDYGIFYNTNENEGNVENLDTDSAPEVNLQVVTGHKENTGQHRMINNRTASNDKHRDVKNDKATPVSDSAAQKTMHSESSMKNIEKKLLTSMSSSAKSESLKLNPNYGPGVPKKSDPEYSSEERKPYKQQSLKDLANSGSKSGKSLSFKHKKQASFADTTNLVKSSSKKSLTKFEIVKDVRYFSDGAIEETTEKRKILPDGSYKLISSTTVITYEDDNDPDGTSLIYVKPEMPKKPNKVQQPLLMNQQQQKLQNLRQKLISKKILKFAKKFGRKQMRKFRKSLFTGGGGGGDDDKDNLADADDEEKEEEEEEEEAIEFDDGAEEDDENE